MCAACPVKAGETRHVSAIVSDGEGHFVPACSCNWTSDKRPADYGAALTILLRRHHDYIPVRLLG